MPLRIELEELWKRLSTRFKARTAGEEDEGYPVILDTVQPITDFDELAKNTEFYTGTFSRLHASGSGAEVIATVPDGERWHVVAITLQRTGGDMTLTYLYYGLGSDAIKVYSQTASSAMDTLMLPQIVILEEGSQISAYCVAVAADSAWNVKILLYKEDAF